MRVGTLLAAAAVAMAEADTPCPYPTLGSTRLVQNNLGGAGPWIRGPKEMRLEKVFDVDGLGVDLKITTLSEYVPGDEWVNQNRKRGDFVQIHMAPDAKTEFLFELVETGTDKPTKAPEFSLTVFDLDYEPKKRSIESVRARGMSSYSVSEASTVIVSPSRNNEYVDFTAGRVGWAADNPSDAMSLTDVQSQSSVALFYEDVSSMKLELRVSEGDEGGRNFLFATKSAILCERVAAIETCPYPHIGFNRIVVNNLGGLGPDSSKDEELRFSPALAYNGRDVDLKITNISSYDAFNSSLNMAIGDLMRINVAPDSEVMLRFELMDSKSGEPVELPKIALSLLDIDSAKRGSVESARAFGTTAYLVSDHSTVKVDESGGEVKFTAGRVGNFADNPTDVMHLTEEQEQMAAVIIYEGTSTFDIEFGVGPGSFGRSFLFGTTISLACQETPQAKDVSLVAASHGPDSAVSHVVRTAEIAIARADAALCAAQRLLPERTGPSLTKPCPLKDETNMRREGEADDD